MRVAVGVVAAVAVLIAVAGLRLLAGPIDLEFLKTRLAQEFDTPGGKIKVGAERIYAEWSALGQPMHLVLIDLHVIGGQGQDVATAPRIALSFDPRDVVRGRIFPTAIVVQKPTLNADVAREGGMLRRVMAKSDSPSNSQIVDLLIEQLLSEPNHASLLGQLDTVSVEQARVSLRDLQSGVSWVAPDAYARLKRDSSGVIVDATARFVSGRDPIDIRLSGAYARDRSRISIEAAIDGLKPLMLADLSPDAAVLRGVDIALSGRMRLAASGTGDVQSIEIDISGGNGMLSLPGILPVGHQVRSVNAHVAVDTASHTAKIDNIDVDLGTAKLRITGIGTKTEQGQFLSGRAEIGGIPVDRLGEYWPLEFASGGRQWALANLSGGTLDIATEFAVSAPGGDIERLQVERNVTSMKYRDLVVHYMPHMPELVNVSGTARFEGGTLHFDVAEGSAVGLRASGATIELTGLDSPDLQHATLRVPISGPAAAVMALLARPRLGLPKDALYDPKRVSGDAAVNLTLGFPLLNSLAVADIEVLAEASLSKFGLKNALGAVDLAEATGKVVYGNSQLAVSGQGKLDGHSVDIDWRQHFAPKAPFRERYELRGTVPAALVAKAGFPSPEPFVTGPVGMALSYQVALNGSGEVAGKFDLKGSKASLPPLGWTKDAGLDGQLALTLRLAAGSKPLSADFDGRSKGFAAKGQVRFGADTAVQQVNVQQMVLGRSDLAVDWKRTSAGMEANLRGRALDWGLVRQALRENDEASKRSPGATASKQRSLVSLQLEQLLVERGSLGSVNGRLDLAGDRIESAEIAIGGGKGSAFRVTQGPQQRAVTVYIPDLGSLLNGAGWLDGLLGGDVDFKGAFDDKTPGAPLEGALRVGPYRMETVTPRKDVGTLNSTIEGLDRGGNALQMFDSLTATIKKTGDRIDIKDGRTSGRSLGLTAQGFIDLASDTARMRGVVVPAFALNNLLSNVPLLGPLLTGGKDGGLFAISYRLEGPLDDLKIDVNMMSAVTPGALRELFTAPLEGTTPTPTPLPGVEKSP